MSYMFQEYQVHQRQQVSLTKFLRAQLWNKFFFSWVNYSKNTLCKPATDPPRHLVLSIGFMRSIERQASNTLRTFQKTVR